MQKVSLAAMARQQVDRTAGAGGRHTSDTAYAGHEKVSRQTVIGMSQGARRARTRTRARPQCRCSTIESA
jgi:hypothetical protein